MAQTELAGLSFTECEQPSLRQILKVFSNPINEEQAWAVCYQCANYLLSRRGHTQALFDDLVRYEARAIRIRRDGEVVIDTSDFKESPGNGSGKGPPTADLTSPQRGKQINVIGEAKVIQAIGVTVYQALDYGLIETEERHLSPDLESLIEYMTNPDYKKDNELQNADDEGIENDADEDCFMQTQPTLNEIITFCKHHLSKQQDATHHYKAVCRALVAEAEELLTFLQKISSGKRRLEKNDDIELNRLEESDWARLWVQIMRELRHGVRLKKVQHHHHAAPVEYELTPFEVLLEDIRTRRYTLNKIMVNGDIPPKVKSDAQAVILDFIRSRPPLHPAKNRVLKSLPTKPQLPWEKLMDEIKQKQSLRPIKDGKLVLQTSKTNLLDIDNDDDSPPPQQKVVKVKLHLLLKDSMDDDEDLWSSHDSEESLEPINTDLQLVDFVEEQEILPWQQTVAKDAVMEKKSCKLKRRHTIMGCESPGEDKKRWQNPLECLSLTLEELSHIRSVLTKAELESLVTQKEIYNLLLKNKICFTCKLVKFSLFGQWGTKCRLCKRSVCNDCLRKMHIPTEHFGKIPVYTLSPIPISQEVVDMKKVYESTGSVPQTPSAERREQKPAESNRSVKRRPLQRSHTISGGSAPQQQVTRTFSKGNHMAICMDCKSMILEIIRASRTSVALVNQNQTVPELVEEPEKPKQSRSLLSLNFLGKSKFNPFA